MSDEPAEIPEGEENFSVEKTGFAYHPPGDLPIFKLLSEYRLLLGEHLSLLTGRNPKRLHGRLLQLVENGYINRVLTFTVSEARAQELCTKIPALLSEGLETFTSLVR